MTVLVDNAEVIVKEKFKTYLEGTEYFLRGKYESSEYLALCRKIKVFFKTIPSYVELSDTIYFRTNGFKITTSKENYEEVKALLDKFDNEERGLIIELQLK